MIVTPSDLRPLSMDDGVQRFVPYASGRFHHSTFDYVEQEWIASGVIDGEPYETVVLVRLPRDSTRFSGTLIVEPLHFHGITPMALYTSTYMMREGHGWAMVASQRSTINDHVRNGNPERYASLVIDGPADVEVTPLSFESPEALRNFFTTVKAVNRASSGVLAQVGAALRSAQVAGGREVEHLLLMGHSQTGSVVTYYLEEAHATQRLANGRPVYDGYCPTGFPVGPLAPCEVPIVQVLSDGDVSNPAGTFVLTYPGRQYRQPDSDAPDHLYRLYELAGVPHMVSRHAPFDDAALWTSMNQGPPEGMTVTMNSLPHNELFNVCLHHLVRWVADGVVPPRAQRIEVAPDGWFALDEHGNARGGVRCVQMDVPRARYLPNMPTADGALSNNTVGIEQPFAVEKMASLYGNSDGYRARFEERMKELVTDGWLLADDVEYMRDDFEKVDGYWRFVTPSQGEGEA